ncbi:MAG: hypothetical protein K0B15_06550 [Lentimicrobium sp.]|nr:hypothetical protein [Lentimicrobium sp.]
MHFPQITEMDNQGGNLLFFYIPVTDVVSIPISSGGSVLNDITLLQGAEWFLGYSTKDTLSLESEMITNEQGSYYQHAVKGFYPKPPPALIKYFDSIRHQKFILLVMDSNNRIRIIGSLAQPCSFTFSEITGSRAQDLPGVNFGFNCVNYNPCLFYYTNPFNQTVPAI